MEKEREMVRDREKKIARERESKRDEKVKGKRKRKLVKGRESVENKRQAREKETKIHYDIKTVVHSFKCYCIYLLRSVMRVLHHYTCFVKLFNTVIYCFIKCIIYIDFYVLLF